ACMLGGVALSGVALVSAAILWGLHRERLQLRETLGMSLGVSEEETNVIQHMDDLERLLDPIEKRFGRAKRRHVANFLHLEAQLGLKEGVAAQIRDPQLRKELAAEIAQWEEELN